MLTKAQRKFLGQEVCQRCQGNGEIVTDWNLYLSPDPATPPDAGTADCPDCDGRGYRAALQSQEKNNG